MNKEAFVMVNENEVVFASKDSEVRNVEFDCDDYNDFDEYVAAIVYDCVKDSAEGDRKVRLVLPSVYYNYGEQVVTGVRSKREEKYSIRNFSSPVSSVKDTESTLYIETRTEYESCGKTFCVPDEIPLLQKYLKRKNFLSWNSRRLASLLSYLSEYGIEVQSVVPDIYLYNAVSKQYAGNNVVVSMNERHTDVCVLSGGHIKRMLRFQFGLADMVCRLSNAFGLSCRNSRMLMKMYGFVSVPQQYVNYEIRVPVFEDVVRNVKLTDISYEVQCVLKKQFGLIYNELKGFDIESAVIDGLPVADAHVLFQMMTNYDCNLLSDISFDRLETLFGVLESNSYSEILTPVVVSESKEEVLKEPAVASDGDAQNSHGRAGGKRSAWLDSLVEKINQSREKFNALITE